MGRPVRLEEFRLTFFPGGVYSDADTATAYSEEQRLASYEEGYQAGWDDSSASQSDEFARISSDVARNLRDLAFTYHEARAHVLRGIEPVIQQIVATVLPDLAAQALPELVLERLEACLKIAAEPPITILVAPDARPAVEKVIPSNVGFPVVLRDEPTFASGQVFIRTGDIEESIDTTTAVAEIQALVIDFFTLNERLEAHG